MDCGEHAYINLREENKMKLVKSGWWSFHGKTIHASFISVALPFYRACSYKQNVHENIPDTKDFSKWIFCFYELIYLISIVYEFVQQHYRALVIVARHFFV